jgi:PAS domain S-box-containing protein
MNQIDIQKRYDELINSLPDGIFVIDAHGQIVLANNAAAKILGYDDKQEFIGRGVNEIYANPGDHDSLLSILGHRGFTNKNIFDWKRKDGKTVLIELTATPTHDPGGHMNGFHGIFVDITRKLENQIAQQETLAETAARSIDEDKMLEAINYFRFAPMSLILQGIAHNLNTPLGGIRGRAELLQHHIKKNSDKVESIANDQAKTELQQLHAKLNKGIGEIIAQVDKATELIRGFSAKIAMEMTSGQTEIDLNALIQNELSFLDSSLYFKHKISREIILDPALPKIQGIYRNFSQAVYDLLINSMKATADVSVKKLKVKTSQNEGFVFIEISDNRPPVDAAEMDYHLSAHLDTRYVSISEEARFSLYDVEIANAQRLLEAERTELQIFPNGESRFVIQIPKS